MLTVLRGFGSLSGGCLVLVLAWAGGVRRMGWASAALPPPTTTTAGTTVPPAVNTIPTVAGGGSGSVPVNLTGVSGGSGGISNELEIEATPVVPAVLLLVD